MTENATGGMGLAALDADLARLDSATDVLLRTVAGFDDADVRATTLCEGWTRAHVVTHLARNADSLVNLVVWATTGAETPQYASSAAREADIQVGANRSAAELSADLADSCVRFRTATNRLRADLVAEQVALRTGPLPAREIPRRRIGEVVLHHHDLLAGWSLAEADPQSVHDLFELSLARLRSHPAAPQVTLVTEDGSEFRIGSGDTTRLRGTQAAFVDWLARGRSAGLLTDGSAVPAVPAWG